jgi:chemotaxis protein methyltransferase CheR
MQLFKEIHFQKYASFIYDTFGIHINQSKKDVLEIKLRKLMSKHNIDSYDQYFNILTGIRNSEFLTEFANEITVNKTDFFREINHFNFITDNLNSIIEANPRIIRKKEIRVWSAGCSTGKEPYTIAMILKEKLPDNINVRILATDISTKVLAKALHGVYPLDVKAEISSYYLAKYFSREEIQYRVCDDIKDLVTFRSFNLMNTFSFRNNFDIIFCRNVMIYFDNAVQQDLIDKFYDVLAPGGLLFIGHSESLQVRDTSLNMCSQQYI